MDRDIDEHKETRKARGEAADLNSSTRGITTTTPPPPPPPPPLTRNVSGIPTLFQLLQSTYLGFDEVDMNKVEQWISQTP